MIKATNLLEFSKILNLATKRYNSSLNRFLQHLDKELDGVKSAGTFKKER
jgi:hypothetical protein